MRFTEEPAKLPGEDDAELGESTFATAHACRRSPEADNRVGIIDAVRARRAVPAP